MTRMDERGSITIFLMIVMISLIVLTFVFIDVLRIHYAENKLERTVSVSLESVLAGYNRELKNYYGLLAIRDMNIYEIEETFKDYFYENTKGRDLSRLKLDSILLEKSKSLTNLAVLEEQIMENMSFIAVESLMDFAVDLNDAKTGMDDPDLFESKLELENDILEIAIKLEKVNSNIGSYSSGGTALTINNSTEKYNDGLVRTDDIIKLYERVIADVEKTISLAGSLDKKVKEFRNGLSPSEFIERKDLLEKIYRFQDEVSNSRLNSLKNNLLYNLGNLRIGQMDDLKKVDRISTTSGITEEEYENAKNYKHYDNREETKNEAKNYINNVGSLEDIEIEESIFKDLPSKVFGNEEDDIEYDFVDHASYLEEAEKLVEKINIGEDIISNLYINEYILDKFYSITSRKNNMIEASRYFSAEVEYVLNGNRNQIKNYKKTRSKILLIRFMCNVLKVYTDSEARNKAKLAAVALVGWWGGKESSEIAENFIMLSFALKDATDEVKMLEQGGKVKFIYLADIYFNYEDHIRILLLTVPKEIRLFRILDLIELNLKNINPLFNSEDAMTELYIKINASEEFLFMTKMFVPSFMRFGNRSIISCEDVRGY